MTIFPYPAGTAVSVVVDGKPVPAYIGAYETRGRIIAPVRPFLTRIADRLWFEGNDLVIQRDGRIVRVAVARRMPDALDRAYVPIAPVLRALGASVSYDENRHRVLVRLEAATEVATPEPFNPNAPAIAPRVVFTPTPVATPRPVWTGSPLPRRTPLPFASPGDEPKE